jgi:hypothetical protein
MVEWSLTGVERQHGAYRFVVKDKEGDEVWIVVLVGGSSSTPCRSRNRFQANNRILDRFEAEGETNCFEKMRVILRGKTSK